MSYLSGNPNGKLYVGTVKWSNDYKNVMLFSGRSALKTFMESHLTQIRNDFIWTDPNTYVDILSTVQDVESLNYVYYIPDSSYTDTFFCCFVTRYECLAPHTIRLYLELDIFQMYHYSAKYFQSYIDRAIISKSEDADRNNFLPEPVSAPLDIETKLNDILSDSMWQPVWVLHSASYYEYSDHKYYYQGIGTNNTYGEYGRFIDNLEELKTVLKNYGRKSAEEIAEDVGQASGNQTWKDWINAMFAGTAGTDVVEAVKSTTSIADLQDHRDELIGLYAIPKWLYLKYKADGGNANYADNHRTALSKGPSTDLPTISGTTTLKINTSTLANGYSPRNKKLLSSVCRGYVLSNNTGLQIPFRPELFGSNTSATLTLYGITMSTGGYHFKISNYSNHQTANGEVAYNSERRVGYDANTGINKALAVIGAASGIASGATQIATKNPVAMLSGAGEIGQNLVSAIDSLGTKEQHFGSNGDLLRITGDRPGLHWYEMNPTYDQCAAIDSFFDMFGYSIQRHYNPLKYIYKYEDGAYNKAKPLRQKWDYIKTSGINLQASAPANYENKLKSIFDSGVTLWHDYAHFGNYSQTNNDTP